MTDSEKLYPPLNNGLLDNDSYTKLYNQSIEQPEEFWKEQSKRLDWITPFTKVKSTTFSSPVSIKWFENGELNVSVNCIDRHLEKMSDTIAYIFEPDDPAKPSQNITYKRLSQEVNKLGNALRNMGIKKGDRVTIYMPMVPEATYAMLACARIGAVHSVVFGGFSPSAIKDRIIGCDSKFVITADEGVRGGKVIPLKVNVDEAVKGCAVKKVIVVKCTGKDVNWNKSTDVWYHDVVKGESDQCEPEIMNSEDPLFILYTSGSTGKPKGVLHTTGGYLLYASMTHQYVFDYRPGDVFWCTADIGWVTGHSYVVYGPLANGATSVIFEGVPTYPTTSRHWEIVDKHKVNIYYTAPTAIRALMVCGQEPLKSTTRDSLRILGTVGEPINPEAWMWYYNNVGNKKCPIVDTWWQTETGGIMITPIASCTPQKPGSATKPFFGIEPVIVDNEGNEQQGACQGNLCIKDSWPGQMRTVYKDHKRFEETYFSSFKGFYFTGDGCKRDEDGYYWITGRVDDVLNVSGHRLGSAEIESSLVAHTSVAEAAVVGYPHPIKGNSIYAYVTLNEGVNESGDLNKELRNWVKKDLSPIATPELIHFTPSLPKTRSGKIMRRLLRKIASNEFENMGDTTTLADPSVVEKLIENRLNKN